MRLIAHSKVPKPINQINKNFSIKLPKLSDNAIYFNPDLNSLKKTLTIGRAGKGQNRSWFIIKNINAGSLYCVDFNEVKEWKLIVMFKC